MNAEARYLGKYQLLECVARGGMGEVWKALDSQLKREVAIKLLRPHIQQVPDFIMRFEQEARVIASLHHPNIVEIHDFKIHNRPISSPPESDPPLCYMVMDYVQGETLAHYIYNLTSGNTSRYGQFSPAVDIVYLFTVIGLALDYAHRCGVIHRDIKPANILLDQRMPTIRPMGEPILTDFGIARQYGATKGTIAGCIIGTPKYMAPEQALGRYDDPRSDLYSLGIILYEMITGMTPFHADTPLAIVMQHLHEKPIPPEQINPHISRNLSEVIQKSIAKDPDARFSTAAALALALTEAFNVPPPPQAAADALKRVPTFSPDKSAMGSSDLSPESVGTRFSASVGGTSAGGVSIGGRDVFEQVNVERHEPELGGETKQPWFNNKKKWVFGLASLLMLILLGASLGTLMLFLPASHSGDAIVGHVRFIKNGPSQDYNALQIDVGQVPDLPQGMAYYAWVKLGNEETIPHWKLSVNQQSIHTPPLTFQGVDNLYVPHRLFLITKEQTASSPEIPNMDLHARLYYATIDPTPSAIVDLKQCDGASVCS